MEYYIYHIPVFITHEFPSGMNVPEFCHQVEETLPASLLAKADIDVVYIGQFPELGRKNAAYVHGAIYIINTEPTVFDMLENFVHEVAHALEAQYGWHIYDDNLIQEFKGKRRRLRSLLDTAGYRASPLLYDFTEYSQKFDEFLSQEVGYPTLLGLTTGLFVSPYAATSINEYYANGFEKYFLGEYRAVRDISPTLYKKIEEIVNDES
jgi:hypothetical protein